MKPGLLSCGLLLLMFGVSQNAAAASLRCGNYLISDAGRNGATKYEVLKKCGEPDSRFGHTWIYKRGGRSKELQFSGNGRLVTIRDK